MKNTVHFFNVSCFSQVKIVLLIAFVLLMPSHGMAKDKYELILKKTPFIIPQFSGPFRQRQASISPEEYELANKLRVLLEQNKTKEVLTILDGFYNIELSPAMLLLKAQVYFRLKDLNKAEKSFLAVLARMPQLVRAHIDLGRLYLSMEKNKKARHHLSLAVSYGANDPVVYSELGFLNLLEHNAWSAISAYQSALVVEPGNVNWQQGLLAALMQAKLTDSALALVDEMISNDIENSDLWLIRASICIDAERNVKAISSLEVAMRLNKIEPYNRVVAAKLHLQEKNYARAVDIFIQNITSKSVEIETLNTALSWLLREKSWSQADRLLKAMEKRLASMNKASISQYYLQRGNTVMLQNKKGAINYYQKAVDADPSNGKAIVALADLQRKLKKYHKAEILYSRAEAIQSVEQEALLGKAQVYLDTADYKSALSLLRSIYRKYPRKTDLKENIELLEKTIKARSQVNL